MARLKSSTPLLSCLTDVVFNLAEALPVRLVETGLSWFGPPSPLGDCALPL